jgi:hypothetical protein
MEVRRTRENAAPEELAPCVQSCAGREEKIMTTNQSSNTVTLGATVEKFLAGADAVAGKGATAAELAAHRLERVLVRGGNLRLAAVLADLASELAPTSSTTRRRSEMARFPAARAA